jgi:hypothetical protein
MLILNMALNFTFVCNLERLQMKQSTYPCFHPKVEIDKGSLEEIQVCKQNVSINSKLVRK